MTEKKMQLVDWLDDLCVRFIINLPQEELESVERICFQIEEAQWFYEDFIRPADPSLPQLGLSEFASRLMKHCPLTAGYSNDLHALAFKQFMAYKTRVPVRGAILLDEDMDKVLLVKGYKKNATWSFPRGKINKDEDDLVCAIREVWEETGYDLQAAGLVPQDRNVHCIDVTMREQHLRMFVFRSVPLDTPFEPQTRKEISKIQWYKLSSLPTFSNKRRSQHVVDAVDPDAISASKLYMVAPFLHSLKKWIHQQKKMDLNRLPQPATSRNTQEAVSDLPLDDGRLTQPTEAPVSNPADELKRLLAMNPAVTQPPSVILQDPVVSAEGHQADALLAMLRGSSSGQSQPLANMPPRTPMEQILGNPLQPQSPHVQHVKSSPHATQFPPPDFPLSPNRSSMHDASRAFGQLNLNGSPATHPGNMPFAGQSSHPFTQTSQLQHSTGPHFTQGHSMQSHMMQQQQQQQPQHFQNQQQMMASLQPQGHGAIAHGPAAPKASQLPPPSMNSHTMNLLNALKTPSQHHQQLHPQSAQRPIDHFSAANTSQHFGLAPNAHGYSGSNGAPQSAPNLSMPPQNGQPGQMSQMAPPRSQHQNSLLGLFKSPVTQHALLAISDSHNQQRTVSMQAVPRPAAPDAESVRNSTEPAPRRSSTVAMMTRTLPKARAPSPQKANFDNRGDKQVGGLFPAKEIIKQVQISTFDSSVREGPSKASEEGGNKPPYKILSRPGMRSSSTSASKVAPSPPHNVASSPRGNRPSKSTENGTGQSFTILQRPSSSKQAEPSVVHQQVLPTQNEGAARVFQPQLLRRPKDNETNTASGLPAKSTATVPGGGDQRDTLLALFAKSGQGRGKSVDPTASRMGPPSSGSASPLPMNPAEFRSRIASNASVVSNGDGMKSPVTPVEAKGFLMDYLNGVVKGEHHRGVKRAQQ